METIFTKIAKREIPAYIIDETEEFMAFLDINPAVYGQVVVIPIEWHDPYLFNSDNEFIHKFMDYVKKIAKLLDSKLGSERCRILFEGYGVDHLHAKLYPSFGFNPNEEGFNPRDKHEFDEEVAREILCKFNNSVIQ